MDHSITLSVRSSTDCGMVRPSALAVFRFTTSSNFVGLLDRQVGRLSAFQNLVDEGGSPPVLME